MVFTSVRFRGIVLIFKDMKAITLKVKETAERNRRILDNAKKISALKVEIERIERLIELV